MSEKIRELMSSVRFWQVTAGTVFLLLGHYFPGQEFLWNVLAGWLATVAGIGTLDSIAVKLSSKKEETKVV